MNASFVKICCTIGSVSMISNCGSDFVMNRTSAIMRDAALHVDVKSEMRFKINNLLSMSNFPLL